MKASATPGYPIIKHIGFGSMGLKADNSALTALRDDWIAWPRRSRARPLGTTSLLILLMTLGSLMLSPPVRAGDDDLAVITAKRDQIEHILEDMEGLSEALRDGMHFRVDTLTLELGALILAFPIAEVESAEDRARFFEQIDWLQSFIIKRFERLQERIRQERARFDEFDASMQAAIARAFQHDLRKLSYSYTDTLADLLTLRERLGHVDEQGREQLRRSITLAAERLSGQILLDAMTLSELRNMIRVDAGNTGLIAAERAIERKQNRNLESLENLLGLMESMEISVGGYRALLMAQRGSIGVELLDREVFLTLLGKRLDQARQQLIAKGPNILFKVVVLLSIVLSTYFMARLVQKLVSFLLHRDSVKLHQLLQGILVSLSFGVVFAIGLVIALSTIGISLVPMLAGLGVAGVVIGFALQDTLANFASGWMILIYQPYDVDDHVIAGGVEGTVKRMNLVSTTIATFDNQRLVVPNSRIWGDVITNLTANRLRRLSIPVSVAFGEDLDRVEHVLRDEIAQHKGILKKPEPNVFVDTLGSSEIIMMTHAWVRTEDYWKLLRSLTKRIKQRLDDEDMEIPFPQQDIYIRSVPAISPLVARQSGEQGDGEPPEAAGSDT